MRWLTSGEPHFPAFWDAFLAVDGLDFRQWCNGDDWVVTSLAMRLPNPRMVAIDFTMGRWPRCR